MSSFHHRGSVRRSVRRHPVVVATGAATAGVLLGAFVMAEVFAPVKSGPAEAQAAVASAATPARTAETTGAAPADTVNCDNQTWPYLSRPCAAQLHEREASESKQHAPRIVSTDRLDKATVNAMQAQPLQSSGATSPPPAPAIAAIAPEPDANSAKPAPAIALAPPEHPSAAAPIAAAKADEAPKPDGNADVAKADIKAKAEPAHKHKHVAKKAKRKPAPVARPEDEDDSDVAVIGRGGRDAEMAREAADDQEDDVPVRYRDRRPHVAARWAERAPYDEDGGQRRVIIRRGGVFEQLFGMGGDDDD